jgi:hypothetical protein
MSTQLADLLDLRLAWLRVRIDNVKEYVFIRHPHEIELIEDNLDSWLASIDTDLRTDRYIPGSMVICDAPKPNGAVRPGGHLSLSDQVVYTACVSACSNLIRELADTKVPRIDFSYQLSPRASDPSWFLPYFKAWRNFEESSLRKITEGTPYVIHADIAGYYENIGIDILISDLAQLGVDEVLTSFLKKCLYRWSQTLVPGRGVPQGFSASDVLAKLYLSTVDQSFSEHGYIHHRYVDDYRVFCQSLPEAKKAFVDLSHLMRRKGLVFQSAKSRIHRAGESRRMIEGIQPILQGILGQFVSSISDLFGIDSPYFNLWDAERMLQESPDDAPIEIVQRAYQAYFVESDPSKFDKTLFRFLLRRLGHHGDEFALSHSLGLLARHPEETKTILTYAAHVRGVESPKRRSRHF